MSRLLALSWRDVVRGLNRAGFILDRQRGSHIVLYHPASNATVVVPRHKEIKKGTLNQILRQGELSQEALIKLISPGKHPL